MPDTLSRKDIAAIRRHAEHGVTQDAANVRALLAHIDALTDPKRLAAAIREARPAYIDITDTHNVWQDPDDEPMTFEPDAYDRLAADISAILRGEQ